METSGSRSAPPPSRFPAWPKALASLAALAAPSWGHGNVTAYVDSAGDLWAIGDDLDNHLRIGSGGDDTSTFRIRGGDATTTVNGQAEVTLFAPGTRIIVMLGGGNNVASMGTDYGSNPSCCSRDLIVLTGAGNDSLRGIGPFPSVLADLGPGDDSITWGEGASDVRRALLRTGEGADVIDIDTGLYDSRVETGPGDDRLFVGWGARSSQIDMDSGDDRVTLYGGAGLDLQTGPGNDVIELEEIGAGALTLYTSSGQDDVRMTGSGYPSADPIDPVSLGLGPDDDRLRVGNAVIGTAVFDGGSGHDVYLDLGNVFVSGSPDLRAFDVPKPTLGPALEISTRITGRVVAERGVPVSGAVVFLPELGLLTQTDSEGFFLLDPVEHDRQALELVVGATVRGRSRSGAALVELNPLATSDAGDIGLERDLRNVLVYGAPPPWAPGLADTVQRRLLGLGYQPAEVTQLDTLPEDLSPYGVIWHMGSSIPGDGRQRLAGFVRSGRGLFLSGGSPAQNGALEGFVNQLVAGCCVDIRGPETGGPYAFNPDAAGGVTRTPNVLTTFSDSSFPYFITGLDQDNVLFRSSTTQAPGAVWDSSDMVGRRGRLALVVSPFWISGNSSRFIENLLAFLGREPDGLPER